MTQAKHRQYKLQELTQTTRNRTTTNMSNLNMD